MSYRKKILKELYKFYELKGPNDYVLADSLKSYTSDNKKSLLAFNQLLSEDFIIGAEMSHTGRAAVKLNPNKIREIEKAMRYWYQDPKFWILAGTGIAVLIVAIWQLFLK